MRVRVRVRDSDLRALIALGTVAQRAPHARLAARVAARLAVEDLLLGAAARARLGAPAAPRRAVRHGAKTNLVEGEGEAEG